MSFAAGKRKVKLHQHSTHLGLAQWRGGKAKILFKQARTVPWPKGFALNPAPVVSVGLFFAPPPLPPPPIFSTSVFCCIDEFHGFGRPQVLLQVFETVAFLRAPPCVESSKNNKGQKIKYSTLTCGPCRTSQNLAEFQVDGSRIPHKCRVASR